MEHRRRYVVASLTVALCGAHAAGCGKSQNAPGDLGRGGAAGMNFPSGGAVGTAGAPGGGGAGGAASLVTMPAPTPSYWGIGTNNTEVVAIGLDGSENVYAAGTTQAALQGTLTGTFDTYVRKFDSSGNVLWTLQWGKRGYNYFYDLAVQPDGTFFVTGGAVDFTSSNTGTTTYYVSAYDPSGTMVWTRESDLPSQQITADAANNTYAAGGDGAGSLALRKLDPSGATLWSTPFGTPGIESPVDIARDRAGNIFVATNTVGTVADPNSGVYHGFLYKFSETGGLTWSQPVANPPAEQIQGVAVDSQGDAYVSGFTDGDLGGPSAGEDDGFLRKYDPNGAVLWTRQFGTTFDDLGWSAAVGADDAPYISGVTEGMLAGPMPADSSGFVRKYDPSGAVLWTVQTPDSSRIYCLAVAASGNVYGGGYGNLAPPVPGGLVTKLSVP